MAVNPPPRPSSDTVPVAGAGAGASGTQPSPSSSSSAHVPKVLLPTHWEMADGIFPLEEVVISQMAVCLMTTAVLKTYFPAMEFGE